MAKKLTLDEIIKAFYQINVISENEYERIRNIPSYDLRMEEICRLTS